LKHSFVAILAGTFYLACCISRLSADSVKPKQSSSPPSISWNNKGISTDKYQVPLRYTLPERRNTVNFEQFPHVQIPRGFDFVLGFGAPFYKDFKTSSDGKLELLHQGVSGLHLANSYPRSSFSPENQYSFEMTFGILKEAARSILRSNDWDINIHGNIRIIAESPLDTKDVPYEQLTPAGAILLGRHAFYVRSHGNSADDASYNIAKHSSIYMMDEESMSERGWQHGSLYDLCGYINQGMMEAAEQMSGKAGSLRVEWYAKPISYFAHQHLELDNADLKDVIARAEKDLNAGVVAMGHPAWKAKPFYNDISMGYFKVPGIDNRYTLYQKDAAGNFILKDGKRIYRDDEFSVEHFGMETPILKEPADWIKYRVLDQNNVQHFGREYVEIHPDGSATAKPGYTLHPAAREKSYTWSPETRLYIDGIYRKADGIMWHILKLRHNDKGDFDISRFDPTAKQLPSLVIRPRTEPWTYGGNSIEVREIGEDLLKFEVLFTMLSGARMISTWDDGYPVKDLPMQGKQMYGEDRNWSHYIPLLASYQSIFKNLEGIAPEEWRYIHFYLPFVGRMQQQVISSGIYADNKLLIVLFNPSLENNEKQTLKLKAGDKIFGIVLNGRELKYLKIDVPAGLEPSDFLLHQTNIYGQEITVSGVVTTDFKGHFQ
jgi:hypothetical protein